MSTETARDQLIHLIKDCLTIHEVITRCRERGVVFRPFPMEALFGKGVTASMAELVLALSDGDVFVRDARDWSAMLVIRRTADVVYYQGEFSTMKPA